MMDDPSLLAQAIGWVTIFGGLVVLLGIAVALWRNRRRLPEAELENLLGDLIHDFTELEALRSRGPDWFTERRRRQRELRLASLHELIDANLAAAVAECRARYLDCWAQAATGSPEAAGNGDLVHLGRASASRALSLIRRAGADRTAVQHR
jgi:hypothetical protein